MKNIFYSIPLFAILSFSLNTFSQTVATSNKFRTPEVTAFNRSIETPVSLYTGVPNISIPIYEINIKGVSIPIKLDYHAGGIRVDQDATWVGLGWNLSYGGEISRKIRGIPDEYFYFYGSSTPGYSVSNFMKKPNVGASNFDAAAQNDRVEYINLAKRGGKDYMPDEFYFSALGYSGRFMFSQQFDKFILYPKEDIEVSKFDGPEQSKLFSWKLRLPDGISVDFGKEGCTKQEMSVMNIQRPVTNSWKVKTVKNNYNDSITYGYDNFNYRMPKIGGQQFRIGTDGSLGGSTSISNSMNYDSRIRVINFPSGRVEFSTIGRQDMPNQALSEINVYDNNNNIIKKISFVYSYFYGDAFDVLAMVDPFYDRQIPNDYRYKRLKLDAISIKAEGQQDINYTFEYDTALQMPSKYSFAQDHWGYFNGIPNASLYGFIPNIEPKFVGGDRRVKAENSKVFSLKSITYPEGGKTEFVYEGNTAGVWNVPNELMATYQDDNYLEKYGAISLSSYSRSTSYPSPTEVINGVRYFRKEFTIAGHGYSTMDNWSINTNFGISTLEQYTPYLADNAYFKLEKINTDGSRTLVKDFNTTNSSYPYNNVPPRNGQDNSAVSLDAGKYEMTVALTYLNHPSSEADNQPYNLSFTVKWRELNPDTKMVNVGGIRIKNINYYDSNNNLLRKKSYAYTNPYADASMPNYTSGRIVSFPKYFEYKIRHITNVSTGSKEEFSLNYSSNSILPLETTSGSFAGYEYVNEYDVDITNAANSLRSESRFSFVQPSFSQYYRQMGLGILEPKEWARGKLLTKHYFKSNNLVKKEEYDYYFVSPFANNSETNEDYVEEINTDLISYQSYSPYFNYSGESLPEDFYDVSSDNDKCVYHYYSPLNNHVTSYAGRIVGGTTGISTLTCDYYTNVPYFKRYTGFDKIKSKTITSYETGAEPIVQRENFFYERTPLHYLLTKTTNSLSNGGEMINETKYPLDLNLSGSDEEARKSLVNQHQLNTVLSHTVVNNSATRISQTDYQIDQSSKLVFPKQLKTNTGLGGALEIKELYNRFDNKANILEAQPANGIKTCYLYSYNKQYPIAEIKNLDYSAVENTLSAASILQFSNLANPSKGEIDNFLAPVKLAFSNALITSYTYKPLVGMTSMTDAKGMTTYYEYDGFQRLRLVRDHKQNIVKTYCYGYAGQPISCEEASKTYRSAARSQTFTRNNCPSGQTGSSVTYTVPEGAYSAASQAAADALAAADIAANGQNYANAQGQCLATFSLGYSVPSGRSFYLKLRNMATGKTYDYVISNTSGTITGLPQGSYEVSVNESSYQGRYTFYLGGKSLTGTRVVFPEMTFSSYQFLYIMQN